MFYGSALLPAQCGSHGRNQGPHCQGKAGMNLSTPLLPPHTRGSGIPARAGTQHIGGPEACSWGSLVEGM